MPKSQDASPFLSGRLARDDRGAAVMEFALVAPVLIMLLLGVSDLVPATVAKFKTANATQSVADLVTQFPQMQTSDVVNVFAGGATVLAPLSGSKLILRITNVATDGKGNAFVYWSCGQGSLPPLSAKDPVTDAAIDSSIWPLKDGNYTNTSYVKVESSYVYDAPAKFVLKTSQTMANIAYMLPRQSSYVGFPWNQDPNNPGTGDPNNLPTAPAMTTNMGSTTLSNGALCNYAF